MRIQPVRNIEEPRWAWHIGLDAESTAILNALWAGEEVDAGRMRRILALFRLDFAEPREMRRDIAGRPVYLALPSDEDDVVSMKPQNLLLNLPLARASMKPDILGLSAKRALARRDPVMARIIRAHPRIALAPRGEPFNTLARAIVGQQISVKAAQSVWNRVPRMLPSLSPEEILKAKTGDLRACGLSERKAEYIADLARHFADGAMHVHAGRAWTTRR